MAALLGAAGMSAADIVLNEVQADNRATINHGGDHPDWLELFNNASAARDVGGMSLSDDPLAPRLFTFPTGTRIAGRGRLIVWCDDRTDASGLHTGFALNAEGQTLTLYAAGTVVQTADSITFGPQIADLSIGRVPDGTGTWQLCQPTPSLANTAQPLGAAAKLRINEWMAYTNSGDDWLELFNSDPAPVALGGLSLTDSLGVPGLSPIPALSFIGGGGWQLFWADEKTNRGAIHVNFKLSAGGESIGLYNGSQPINTVTFAAQARDVSEGRLPDGTTTVVRFSDTASPGESNYLLLTHLVVNELLAHTDPPLEDAVELHNPTSSDLNISGWYLSNNRSAPRKYVVPNGTIVRAGGFHVFYEYQFDPDPLDPASFTFNSAHGDEAVFSQVVGDVLTGYRVYEKFPATANGVSLGRYATSTGYDFTPLSRRTFGQDNPATLAQFRQGRGATNADPLVGPVVLSEIMYHPPDLVVGTTTNDNTLDEFIELRNLDHSSVPLYDPLNPGNTWRLRNGVDFRFPVNTTLTSQGHLLVVSFDPATNATALTAFRSTYAVPPSVPILGPYKGKLDNGGESVELARPDLPQEAPHPDAGFVPYIEVDRVHYQDTQPWPEGADGSGQSLQRLSPGEYGNDPANWFAGPPTAGRFGNQITLDSIRVAGAQVIIGFIAEAGRTYTVQYCNSATTGAWQKLVSFPSTSQEKLREATDPLGGSGQTRFYRLVSPATP